jgi:3-hydroxyisobutyrate dehydrogenase-like beta-hydroxyacid dehydrogenase
MSGTVALIGMGLLGSALAENLLKAGFAVRGYDTAPERMQAARRARWPCRRLSLPTRRAAPPPS